jgi:hypothetical protein
VNLTNVETEKDRLFTGWHLETTLICLCWLDVSVAHAAPKLQVTIVSGSGLPRDLPVS